MNSHFNFLRASNHLYNKLLSSIFRAPVNFFDTNPSGIFLSRFGREMDVVDRSVPDGIGSVLFCFLQIFLSIMALAGAVTPFMLIPLVGLGAIYAQTMSRFRPPARKFLVKECIFNDFLLIVVVQFLVNSNLRLNLNTA